MVQLPLSERNLSELRRQCLHHNTFPIDLDWVLRAREPSPVLAVLEPLHTEAVQYLATLNRSELNSLIEAIPAGLRMFIEAVPSDAALDDQQLSRIGIYYIAWQLHRSYSPLQSVISPTLESSEVLRIYPELRDKLV